MAWIYQQATGRLLYNDEVVGIGYSGHLEGLNDPAFQDLPFVGPIPQGLYNIGPMEDSPTLGPETIILAPDPSNQMFGRDNFRIHGDSVEFPGQRMASDGCIIMSRDVRETVWNSGDRVLQVVSGEPI
jgi:Protein of unknown function (DUF2778)